MRWNVIPVAVNASVSRGWKSHSPCSSIELLLWRSTPHHGSRNFGESSRILAGQHCAGIRRVITLYVYGGNPFVEAPLSMRRVIYRGKPTYHVPPSRHRSIRRGENFQSSRGSRSISAGSFTTPEFVTNSGASVPDVYYPSRGVPTDK